jgi:hypothetical protein
MAWTQDDADDFLKLFAQVEQRNKPTEADLKEQRRLERQKELLEAAKAEEEQKDDRNIFEKAGGAIAGGAKAVGGFVKDAAVSVKDDAVNAVTGIKDTIEGSVATDNQSELQEGLNNISNKYNKEIIDIYGKYQDKGITTKDGGADESRMDKADLDRIAQLRKTKDEEIAKYKGETDFDAQSELHKKEFDEAQAVDAKKTAGAAASTFLNVATLGAGTAVKAGGKQAITTALKEGGKKLAAKEIAKRAAIAGAEGAVFGGAGGAASAAARDEDVLEGAAKGAAFGGIVGGTVGGATGAGIARKAGKVDDVAAKAGSVTDDLPGVDKLADDLNADERIARLSGEEEAAYQASRKAEFDQIMGNRRLGLNDDGTPFTEGQKLLEAGDSVRPLREVEAEIQDLQTNGAPDLTPEQAKAKWAALQDERQVALRNDSERGFQLEREDARAQFENNGLPNELDEAQKAFDDFQNGNVELPTIQDTPVVGAKDIFAHENMPVEIKTAASELLDDQRAVQQQLDNLTSGENARLEQQNLDDSYRAAMEDIEQMPAPRQELELERLNERYLADTEDLKMRYERDQPKVEEMKRIQTHLQNKEEELVRQSNYLMEQAPDQFRSVDEAEFVAQRTALADNLDTAKRFNDNAAIVEDISTSTPRPERVVSTDPDVRNAYQTQVLSQTDIPMKDIKNLSGVREAMLNFTSPSKNIKALTGSDEIFSGIIRAESAVNTANKADIDIISSIAGRIKSKEQASQIIDYVEGKRTTLSSFDEETANVVKNFFDDKKAKLNDLGYKTLDDYFPHLFNKNDPNVKRLFKGKTTADISFGNLKKRMEEGGDYSRDIIEVMAGYSRGFNRKVYLEPALKPLEDVKMQANATKAVGDWVDGYIENLKGITEPSGAEKAFNGIIDSMVGETKKGGNHYRQTLGAQRMISAVATMGLNPGTAIRNMTQVVNTVAGIGVKRATQGAIKATRAFAAGKNSPEWKEMIASGVFDGGISRHYMADLDKAAGNISGIAAKGEKAANFMMGMIRGTDISLRAQAYWGAKAQGLDDAIAKGLKGEAAEKFAKDFAIKKVADTQFITSAADMPVKLNGAGVRSLTQLATFSIKQAEMLGELGIKTIKRADGTYGLNVKQAGNLLAAASTAALFTEALKPVIGFNEKEWIPFYDQIASIVDPDSTAGESLYRSPLVSLFAGNGKGKIGLFDAIKSGKMDEFLEDNWSQIVPAGTQIKKTVEGIETTQSGISKNPNGKVRYLQDMDLNSQLKASLFGQYSTDAGRQWIKDGFPTLTDSEMRLGSKEGSGDITFEQLPRETQQEFYDYYAATKKVTGRSTVLDEIKQAVRDGNIKKAQRIGDEYNKKAQEAMQGYFQKHQELPEELQDDMVSKLFIDVQGKIDDTLEED